MTEEIKTYTFIEFLTQRSKEHPDLLATVNLALGTKMSQTDFVENSLNVALHDAICGGTSNPFFSVSLTEGGEHFVSWNLSTFGGWNSVLGVLQSKMETELNGSN